ncbi:MAG: hypothetical protein PF495_03810 [Spirochaetales bacterium]|jgi:hypothetical protein|nr:hypothetical protein [Spirochaetales bacterium]
MIILQYTSPEHDTIVHDDGTIYTDGKINTIGTVTIVDGKVETLSETGGGVFEIDINAL